MSRLADPRQHDDLLNYQLKLLFTLGGAPAVRLCEGRYGIARQEWRFLAALVEDGPMSTGELALRTHIEPGRVSRTVAKLKAKGLVAPVAPSGGASRVRVSVTEAGRTLHAELWPQLAAINRRIVAVLDESEALVLEDMLQRLTAHALSIYEAGGGVDARTNRRLGGTRRVRERLAPAIRLAVADK